MTYGSVEIANCIGGQTSLARAIVVHYIDLAIAARIPKGMEDDLPIKAVRGVVIRLGIERQSGLAGAVYVHHIDLIVSVTVGLKCDLATVRTYRWRQIVAGHICKVNLARSVGIHQEDLTAAIGSAKGTKSDLSLCDG
jgi:hypothetical protein